MVEAYLALGSNIGERENYLRAACEQLHEGGARIEAKSALYESQSVEGGGEADFLNAVVRVAWAGSASQLLQLCQRIETHLGRPQPPRHGPRVIDIDILLFGDERHETPELQVPHPRMNRRNFVLQPLLDVLKDAGQIREYSRNW